MGLLMKVQAEAAPKSRRGNRSAGADHEQVAAPGAPQETPAGGDRKVSMSIDIGKNVVLAIVVVGLIVALIVGDEDTRKVVLPVLTAVIAGGLGITIGEQSGAKEAEKVLRSR